MPTFTRRQFMMFVSAAGVPSSLRLYARDSDFWNKKEPAEWSRSEVEKLTSRSPWAKEINATTPDFVDRSHPDNGPDNGTRSPGSVPGIGESQRPVGPLGVPGGSGRGRPSMSPQELPMQFSGVVRWESAQPLRDALRTPLPDAFAKHYVISVTGIPILAAGRLQTSDGPTPTAVSKAPTEEALERLQGVTYLEVKGRSPIQPGLVRAAPSGSGSGNMFLFGFSRDLLPLTPADKEVTFTSELGNLQVKVRFNLKDMMYRKELAL